MTDIIHLVVGLVIGVPVGMFLMSLCVISKDDNTPIHSKK